MYSNLFFNLRMMWMMGSILYFWFCFSFFFGSQLPLQDFSDPRDADDARYSLDGRELDGSRLVVEFAKGVISLN